MKKLLPSAASLTLLLAMSGCASPLKLIPVTAACPALPPAPAEVMVKRQRLSQDQLQRDLLSDTPTTTK